MNAYTSIGAPNNVKRYDLLNIFWHVRVKFIPKETELLGKSIKTSKDYYVHFQLFQRVHFFYSISILRKCFELLLLLFIIISIIITHVIIIIIDLSTIFLLVFLFHSKTLVV